MKCNSSKWKHFLYSVTNMHVKKDFLLLRETPEGVSIIDEHTYIIWNTVSHSLGVR